MDGSAALTPQQLIESLRAEFEQAVTGVAAAVNAAPDGRVISGSEHQVKDLMDGLRARVFERALQLKADAVESVFSPGGRLGPADAQQGAIDPLSAERVRADAVAAAPVAQRRGGRGGGSGAGRRGVGGQRGVDQRGSQ